MVATLMEGFVSKPILVKNIQAGAKGLIWIVLKLPTILWSEMVCALERMVWMVWSLGREVESLLTLLDRLELSISLIMNIIVWNCRGALKPNFQRHVSELVRIHNPDILVVMETRVGGDRAKEITDRLPFDGAIIVKTMGFAGGIWLLWNSARVEVVQLMSTEQEVHAEVKVLPSNFSDRKSVV